MANGHVERLVNRKTCSLYDLFCSVVPHNSESSPEISMEIDDGIPVVCLHFLVVHFAFREQSNHFWEKFRHTIAILPPHFDGAEKKRWQTVVSIYQRDYLVMI